MKAKLILAICLFALIAGACRRNPTTTSTQGSPSPLAATTTTPATGTRSDSKLRGGSWRVYVTNEQSGDLSVIDGVSHSVMATIPLGKRPRGIHPSADGKQLFIALSGSPIAGPGVNVSTLPMADKKADGIGVVDVTTNTFVKLMPAGSDPEEFASSSDGSKLYVANEDAGIASLLDLSTGRITKSWPVGEEPEGVSLRPDGKVVYVTSEDNGTIAVIDTAKQAVVKTFRVGRRPRVAAFLPDGSRAYVSLENDQALAVVDALNHTLIKTVTIGKVVDKDIKPMGIAVHPDGNRIFVSTGRAGRVFSFDTATDMAAGDVVVGPRPWGIAISPDGKFLYTANGPSNDVSVVDTATLEVLTRINVGNRPWGVAVLKQN